MNTVPKTEMDRGSRPQTISGLFLDEVTHATREDREGVLSMIRQTSGFESSARCELPMFFISDVAERALVAAAPASREFDLIRI